MRHIRTTIICPNGACGRHVTGVLDRSGSVPVRCAACGQDSVVTVDDEAAHERIIRACPVCRCRELFTRKDFPQRLGLGIVVVFGATASVFYYFEQVLATFAILAAAVAMDALIYMFVGRVTVCYRCRAEFRGVAYNPAHRVFDLSTSEKYP